MNTLTLVTSAKFKRMHPIIINHSSGNQDYDFDEFSKKFITICEQHQREGRALAFAFILFDERHAEILKILDDKRYWGALHKISGKYLTVFSFKRSETKSHIIRKGAKSLSSIRSQSIESEQDFVKRFFDRELNDQPGLLFFQVKEGKVLEPDLMPIKAEKIEDAFLEIKNILKGVADSLSKVDIAYRENHEEIFNQIKNHLYTHRFVNGVIKVVLITKTLHGFLSSLK